MAGQKPDFYIKIENVSNKINGFLSSDYKAICIEALDSNNNIIDNKVFLIHYDNGSSVIAESISPNSDGTYTVTYNTTTFICDAQGNIIENLGHSG